MPAADVTLQAYYVPLHTLNMVCSPAEAGTISATLGYVASSSSSKPLYYGNKFQTEDYPYYSIYYSVTPNSGYSINRIIITYTNSNGETVTEEKGYSSSSNQNVINTFGMDISGDLTLTAVFSPFSITTECIPAEAGTISAPSTASSGERVDFSITTNNNYGQYKIKDVTITTDLGNTIAAQKDETTGNYYFTMPANSVHIVAELYEPAVHNISFNYEPEGAGFFEAMPSAREGDEAQFAVEPNDGYVLGSVTSTSSDFDYQFLRHLDEWYEDQHFVADIYSFVMPDEDITLTAHFIPADTRFSITAINDTPERGTVDVATTAQVASTVHVIVQGTEDYACIADSLKLYYNDANNNKKPISVTASNMDYDNNVYTFDFVMPAADVYIEPTFEPIYSLVINSDPSEGGTLQISCESSPYYGNKYLENSNVLLSSYLANDGYELTCVILSGQGIGEYSIPREDLDNSIENNGGFQFQMPPMDVTITAKFGKYYNISLSCSPEDAGHINLPLSKGLSGVQYGFDVYPNSGFTFDQSDVRVYYVNQQNETVDVPVVWNGDWYTYIMPDADVTIHVDFKPAYTLSVIIDPENAVSNHSIIIDNKTINGTIPQVSEGKQVKISFKPSYEYILQGVSMIIYDATTGEVVEETPLTASHGYYTFTMPNTDVTVKATLSSVSDSPLYLLGTANGSSTWNTSGVPFKVVDGQYSATVYFKGYSDDDNETDGWGYFMLSTASDENNDWSAIADKLLSAPSDKFPALKDGESYAVQQLYNEYHYDGTLSHRFMIPAGIYTITVSGDLTTMTINKINPSISIDPTLYYIPIGHPIKLDGLDWVLNTVLKANPYERDYEEHVTAIDSVGDWESNHFNNRFVVRSPGITTVTATNKIGDYITASITREYRTFDLEFPPLAFIEGSNPIDYPNVSISSGQPVTVGDELIGVWGAKNILWAKDQGQHSAKFLYEPEGPTDYLRKVFKFQKRDWDQSNWVMLDFGQLYPDWETDEEQYLAMHEKIASYVDHKIEARTVKGTYNPMATSFWRASNGYGSTYEYTKGMHKIVLSDYPVAKPNGTSLGYPGYVEDPTEKPGKFYADPSQYMYNHYTPVNFMGYYYKPSELIYGSMDQYQIPYPFVYSAGQNALSDDDNTKFFFMQPKDAEIAQVWAVWKGKMQLIDDYDGRPMVCDVFETYQPGIDAQGNSYNAFGLEGAFQVYSWEWNRLPATDADQMPRYGRPENGLKPDTAYLFHVAILHAYNSHKPLPTPVWLGAGNGAYIGSNRDANAPTASSKNPNTIYRVFPLDMTWANDATTGVDEAVIDRNDAAYEIVDITYYNLMGIASDKPFNGINIEVTTYSDGHKTSKKLLIPAR